MCIKARGKEDAHRRNRVREPEGARELKSIKDDKVVKIISMKDQPSGRVVAYRVDAKGPGVTSIVKRLVKDPEELGGGVI